MRILDLYISVLGLIFLAPLFLLLAVVIKLTSPGPIFYRARRVGKDGRLFYLYKFRSMQAGADQLGPGITATNDPRITPVGRFLRRTKLDELPQLINVLKDEMSLVGPRPEDPRFVELYSPQQRQVLQVRPGIVSAATLTYRYEEQMLSGSNLETVYRHKIMPAKLAIDLDYLSRRTLWTDIGLILRAVVSMFTPSQQFFSLVLGDSLGVFLAFLVALAFRFDGNIPAEERRFFVIAIPFIILLYCVVNIPFGLYAHIWRYTSAREIGAIAGSTVAGTFILFLIILFRDVNRPLPLSVILLGGLLSALAFTAVRYRQRLLTGMIGRLQKIVGSPDRQLLLIVGAGEAGQSLAQQVQAGSQFYQYELVGFIDDDPHKLGMRVHSVPILGVRYSIPAVVTERGVSLIVIAVHNISGPDLREILSICLGTRARVKLMPDFLGTMNDFKGALPLKDITPMDLLGRESYQIDKTACRQLITGKTVLVTGAAGSIGSELCCQILNFQPRQLLMLDNNETGLYDLTITFQHGLLTGSETVSKSVDNIIPIVADVSRQSKMEQIFSAYHPQVVFHAAAYKHVPLMEQQPDEAVRVNVLGTRIVTELAARYAAERFVLISSDKAINPGSIMGATKRLGEMMIMNALATAGNGQYAPNDQDLIVNNSLPATNNGQKTKRDTHPVLYAAQTQWQEELLPTPSTKFTAVRFGNVLGSRGSVVPTFSRQIELGGPITVTHPDMKRYFMSLIEAVSLVIQAAALTEGNDLFMLDMGQEIRIEELAHKMIRLRGLRPGEDIPIEYTGIRPGEKLHEELLTSDEEWLATTHPKIFRIQHNNRPLNGKTLGDQITHLINLADTQRSDEMVKALWQLVQ